MEIKKIAAFSLLAHINDNNIGIKSFQDIFIPIVKSSLCRMNHAGVKSGGSIMEIKDTVDKYFSLDIPIPILRELLLKISNEVEKNPENQFILHTDGAFQMNKYIFADYEEEIDKNEEEINEVEKIYKTFLSSNGLDSKTEPSIFDYIDSNRINLSKFFAYQNDSAPEIEFIHQANFINSIKSNQKVYGILRKIYLGSLIAAYLEVEIGEATNKVDFLLDTNFILGLLDLNSTEATHTCRKISEIADKLGYTKTILPFTIEEIELLIERKASQIENAFFQGYLDPESIYNAAKRRNLSKTQLQQISNKLSKTLEEEFKINIVKNDQKFRNLAKYQYSKIYEFYKGLRGAQGFSALHDTTTIVYVKEKRGGQPIKGDLMKANCWFVTNTPFSIPLPENNGYLPEIIRAEELLNFLWLSNPSVTALINSAELTSLGLTRLVSTTISNSLPSSKVLRNLDDNFNTYAATRITADDALMIAAMISKKRIEKPEELNRIALKSPQSFITKVKEYADEGRQEEKELKEKLDKIFDLLNQPIETKHIVTQDDNIEKGNRNYKYSFVIISFIFISAIWWTYDKVFDLKEITNASLYLWIKIAGQILAGTLFMIVINKSLRGTWITTSVALTICLIMLSKPDVKKYNTNQHQPKKIDAKPKII